MVQRFCLLFLVFVLAACSSPRLPFEKDLPAQDAMISPPWETLVKAGPGAEKELDLETLNGPGSQIASAAPSSKIPDGKQTQKPGIVIKSVAVPTVQGAAGSGNADLTEAMRQVLREAGWPVVNAPAADALTIRGKVKTGPVNGATKT